MFGKRFGTRNKLVNAQCTIKALATLAGVRVEIKDDEVAVVEQSVPTVKEVSRKDAVEHNAKARRATDEGAEQA